MLSKRKKKQKARNPVKKQKLLKHLEKKRGKVKGKSNKKRSISS